MFFRTKVRATTPPGNTDFVAKALVSVGGSVVVPTRRMAVPGAPGPPLVEVGAAVFGLSPDVVGVTFTVTLQEAPIARFAPESEILFPPAFATRTPPHVVLAPLGVLINSPAGSRSLNPTPVSGTGFNSVFERVMVKMEDPPTRTDGGEKVLIRLGGAMTVKLAEALVPVPPGIEETGPVMLFFKPGEVPFTETVIVQLELPATFPPTRVIVVGVIVSVPPQVLVAPIALAVTPEGSVSFIAALV